MTAPKVDRQSGFSLLEILISVAVMIIVLTIAIPNFTGVVRSNRLTTAVNDFVGALHLTRSEAVRAGGATICASDNQEDCNSTDWHDGWIVFSDFNSDGNHDADEPVIRASDSIPESVTIDSAKNVITYSGNGFLSEPGIQSVVFCNKGAKELDGREVKIGTAGRPNTEIYGSCT
jgi:type IV fimbrial biogenesis protein FimT